MGWYNERHRHSLAARGIATRRSFASVEDAEREALLRFLIQKRQQEDGSGELQTPILDAQEERESKMEAWVESAFGSDHFVIHLNPEMTGVDQPLHFEKKMTPRGVYWVGELPAGEGEVTARPLAAQSIVGILNNWYPVIEDVEVLE